MADPDAAVAAGELRRLLPDIAQAEPDTPFGLGWQEGALEWAEFTIDLLEGRATVFDHPRPPSRQEAAHG